MIHPPPIPVHPLIRLRCAWCHAVECVCSRTCPCACGGIVVEMEDMGRAMRAHQGTPLHVAWRARLGL